MNVSASVWSAGDDLRSAVLDLRDHVDAFHIDVMDGRFVPTRLFGVETIAAVSDAAGAAEVDVHLMVEDPDAWIAPCAAAGADRVTVHPEACADLRATLAELRARRIRTGVAIALDDQPVERLLPLVQSADRVLVMGTPLGVKGRALDERALARVRALRAALPVEIYVDGGIRAATLPAIAASGADGVVAGSIVFDAQPREAAVRRVRATGREA